jgi:hypothetical protein
MPEGPGQNNALLWAQGDSIKWDDVNGGIILLSPPNNLPGQLSFYQQQCRIWHLLREPGPDNGYPVPLTGDFPQPVVQRDLNVMLAQFISATGLAPSLSDKMVTVGVLPVLDYPLPPDYQSLTRVEYTPAGQQNYTLIPASFAEFDSFWSSETTATGQPFVFRQPWAGYIRLFPQPGPGNAFGPGIGTVTFSGTPVAGNQVTLSVTNTPNPPVVIPTYTVTASDAIAGTPQVCQNVANLVANSNCCVGPNAFLQYPSVADNSFQMTAINPPGTQIGYTAGTTSTTMIVTPNGLAYFQQNGDTITFYYSSTGNFMSGPNDTPGIPVQFHMALVYGVLADYWLRKQDPDGLARVFKQRFDEAVGQAKRLEWDSDRAVNPTAAAFDEALDTATGTWF